MGVGTKEFLVSSFLSMQLQLQLQLGLLARGDMFGKASSGERSSKAALPKSCGRSLHMLCRFGEVVDAGVLMAF